VLAFRIVTAQAVSFYVPNSDSDCTAWSLKEPSIN
jgi:hypothetical protein